MSLHAVTAGSAAAPLYRPKSVWAAAGLAAAFLLTGCADVPRDAGFPDVAQTVAERRGGARIHWQRGTDEDRRVEESVNAILARELTVDEAVQVALLNSPELQAVYEDLMVAQADLVAAGLLSNPVFSLDYRFIVQGGTSVEGTLTQNFLDLFFIPLRKRIASAGFEAAKARVTAAVVEHAARTAAAYYRLVAAEQRLELRRQVAMASAASAELARRLRDAGNITALDLSRELAQEQQARLDAAATEAEVLRSREALAELMGVWGAGTGFRTAKRLPDPADLGLDAAEAERRSVRSSLALSAAWQELDAAGQRLGLARPQGLLSPAEAGVAYTREADGKWGLGPSVTVPIPIFNQGQPAVARAQAEWRRAAQRYTAAAVRVRARVRLAYADADAGLTRARQYRDEALPLRTRIVEEAQAQYNAMRISPFELLAAKQEQVRAAERSIDTLREYWLARVELDSILAGGLERLDRSPSTEPLLAPDATGGPRTGRN